MSCCNIYAPRFSEWTDVFGWVSNKNLDYEEENRYILYNNLANIAAIPAGEMKKWSTER